MEDKRLRKQDQARTKARERRSNENQAILDLQYTLPMNGGLLRTVDKATVLRLTNRYMLLRYQLSQRKFGFFSFPVSDANSNLNCSYREGIK